MADTYGRLTGRAGVCLGTLGPGALNLVTAVADAYLDSAPLVALTGQGDLERMHKESHQYIDLLRVMRPITKWNARLNDPRIIPEVVRKAFKVAQAQKPGATHIELPEDVMEQSSTPRRCRVRTDRAPARALRRASCSRRPRSSAGPRARSCSPATAPMRVGAAPALREFAERHRHPGGRDVHGQGPGRRRRPDCRSARSGLQAGDYAMAGFDEADVVITVGFDLVEHSPEHWNAGRDKRIVCIDTVSAEVDEYFITEVDLVGDMLRILERLAEECRQRADTGGSQRLREVVLGRFEAAQARRPLPGAAAAGAVGDPPGARPRGHPDLRRGPAQALDRADVPGLRAQHRAHRQRPGGHGLRAPGRRSRPSSCTPTATWSRSAATAASS